MGMQSYTSIHLAHHMAANSNTDLSVHGSKSALARHEQIFCQVILQLQEDRQAAMSGTNRWAKTSMSIRSRW